jgi:hypothetical protein
MFNKKMNEKKKINKLEIEFKIAKAKLILFEIRNNPQEMKKVEKLLVC